MSKQLLNFNLLLPGFSLLLLLKNVAVFFDETLLTYRVESLFVNTDSHSLISHHLVSGFLLKFMELMSLQGFSPS